MSIAAKDLIAFGSLAVSAFALLFSVQAKQEAQNLDELVFRSETVHRLLKEVHDSTAKAASQSERMAGCLYAGALAKAEERVVSEPEHRLVVKLFLDQVESGLMPQNCVVGTLELLEQTPLAGPSGVSESTTGHSVKIGRYHALIASYVPSERSCEFAKDDVEEFTRLLSGRGLGGLSIYIARTVKSNSLAVTVDTGEDRERAIQARNIVRSVSENAEGNTGHDTFVQVNSDWYLDPSCMAKSEIS